MKIIGEQGCFISDGELSYAAFDVVAYQTKKMIENLKSNPDCKFEMYEIIIRAYPEEFFRDKV